VKEAIKDRAVVVKVVVFNLNRVRRRTPAVTRVEEWTKDETGVGADMASGSQVLKGNRALLVADANNTHTGSKVDVEQGVIGLLSRVVDPWARVKHTKTTIKTSPRRLVVTVISADCFAEGDG